MAFTLFIAEKSSSQFIFQLVFIDRVRDIKLCMVSVSSTPILSVFQWKLYHIYNGSYSCRKVIRQVTILSFLLKHISLNCRMLSLRVPWRVSSDTDVTIDQDHLQFICAIQMAKCLKCLLYFNTVSCLNYFFPLREDRGCTK